MDVKNIAEIIIQTLNSLFNSLYASIDNNVYSILDDITFISKDILDDKFSGVILGGNVSQSFIIIADSLLFGLAIFYAIRLFLSSYTTEKVEKPYQFIFKFLIIAILVNFSYFLCEQILNINFLMSASIRSVGENLIGVNISFQELVKRINMIISFSTTLNVFSFDGMIKSFTSFGLISLLFSYALRYVMIKVFILLTPFVLVALINNSTSWIFKSWIKSVLTLLIVQSIISVILIIIFATDFSKNDALAKLIYIGSIYALIKANSFTRQIIGGISTDVSANITSMTQIFK